MTFAILTANTTLTATNGQLHSDPDGTHSFTFSSGAEEEFLVLDDDATFDDGTGDGNQVVASSSTIFLDNAPVASRHKFDLTPDNGDPPFTVYLVFENSTPNDDSKALNISDYAIVSETPLIAGVTYSISNHNFTADVDYSNFSNLMLCYAPGTLIETPDGPRAVETLAAGDILNTLDHGPQPIRWVHRGDHPLEAVEVDAKPVQIAAGALGSGLPTQDLIVSPQHRMFVGGGGQLDGWFKTEAFAPAKSLTAVPGIRHMKGKSQITWIHFACDRHEVVTANGCLSESLLLGPMVVNGLTIVERHDLNAIFGTAMTQEAALNGPAARDCLKVGEVRRHLAKCIKEKEQRIAKEIKKWDVDLAMEQYEAERLRDAKSMIQIRNSALRVA